MGVVKIEATKAKHGFSKLQTRARSADLAITRHGRVQAYVISPDRYGLLKAVSNLGEPTLQELDVEFDALMARMQGESHGKAVQALETLPLDRILEAGALARKPRKRARR